MAFIDSDELIVPRQGGIIDLLDAQTDCAGIHIYWAMFGSSGYKDRPSGLMIETFTKRALEDFRDHRLGKSIVRPGMVTGMKDAHVFTVCGKYITATGKPFCHRRSELKKPDYSVVQVNHYFTRSEAEWNKKVARGYRTGLRRREQDFEVYDRCEVDDRSAIRFAGVVKGILEHAGL